MRPEIKKIVESLTSDKWSRLDLGCIWIFKNKKQQMRICVDLNSGHALLDFKGVICLDKDEDQALVDAASKILGIKNQPTHDSVMQEISEMEL